MIRKLLIPLTGLLLVAMACGGGSSGDAASEDVDDGHGHVADSTTSTATMHDDDHVDDASAGHADDFAWGRPADASDATRVIEIEGSDDFRFHPDTVTVEVGEFVTFHVTNSGVIPHEVVLGTADEQSEHAAEMADMEDGAMEHDETNELELAPGESGDLTFEFTRAGTLLFGCHEPAHYEAGMVGTLFVAG